MKFLKREKVWKRKKCLFWSLTPMRQEFDEVLKDICFEPQQVEFLRLAPKALLAVTSKTKTGKIKRKTQHD